MKKFLVGSALIWATALPAFGQAKAPKQPQKHVQVQPVAARPEDVASIEAIRESKLRDDLRRSRCPAPVGTRRIAF